jgi:arginase
VGADAAAYGGRMPGRRPGATSGGLVKEQDVRKLAIIEAPSVLGLRPTGVEELPDALLAAGLAGGLGAVRAGRVEPPPYDPERDPDTEVLNAGGIAAYSSALADTVGGVLDDGRFPVVLGGDCSVLLGNLLALQPRPARAAVPRRARRLLPAVGGTGR